LKDFYKNFTEKKELQVARSREYTFDSIVWTVCAKIKTNSKNEYFLAIELWCKSEIENFPIPASMTFILLNENDSRLNYSQSKKNIFQY